jgi:hypothetical protein
MDSITLRFKGEDAADRAKLALQAPAMSSAIWEFKNFLRNIYKYEELPEDQAALVERIRDGFHAEFSQFLD